jgi:hypothetical protein
MSIHFEYGPNEKASLRKLVGLCDVALALIRERRQLLKLLRENPGSEKRNNVVSATFERLQDLEQVSHLIQLAFRDPVGNKDGGGAVEAVGEDERGTLVLHSAPAIPQQSAGPIITGMANVPRIMPAVRNPKPKPATTERFNFAPESS